MTAKAVTGAAMFRVDIGVNPKDRGTAWTPRLLVLWKDWLHVWWQGLARGKWLLQIALLNFLYEGM